MTSLRRRLSSAAALAAAALALAGCRGPSVPMEPAPLAATPECADVSVRLPESLAGLDLRVTNAQATGAWGTPASVLLRCGVPAPGPTTAECVSVNGIDWIQDDSRAPSYVFTTYGRSPAVQVTIDASTGVSGLAVLTGLEPAVSTLPSVGGCVGAGDVGAPGTATATPGA